MNIYVGNLPFSISDADLEETFGQHGQVTRVNVVTDRDTGRPRGFAFVDMPDDAQARAAIAAINGTSIGGRVVSANEARPREDRGPRAGGGGYGNRSGGGGGGRGRW